MTLLRRFATSFAPFFVLGACAQIIGLSDYERGEVQADAGEGGDGFGGTSGSSSGGVSGTGAKGGSGEEGGEGGDGGKGGRGGRAGAGGTATGGMGGEPDGGEAGQGGSGGMGGSSGGGSSGMGGSSGGGVGGQGGMGGGAGAGGTAPCTEITLGEEVETSISGAALYFTDIDPELGGSGRDVFSVEFWSGGNFNGDATGTFVLGSSTDDGNYATCSRCVLAVQDNQEVGSKTFFATEGTLVVAPTSQQMDGSPDVTFSDVTLREVTISSTDFTSTLVSNGACIHLQSGRIQVESTVPPDWDCDRNWYMDADCDCGCGAPDPTCADASVGSCTYCWCDADGSSSCAAGEVNETSNWICL